MTILTTKLIIAFLFIFSILFSFAEKDDAFQIDSLKNVLSGEIEDTARLNTSARLAFAYTKIKKVSEAEKVIHEAFMYAKKNSLVVTYQLHWADATVLNYLKDHAEALSVMEKTVQMLSETDNHKEIAIANNYLAYTLMYNGKFSECIDTYNKNIEFAKKHMLKDILPISYYGLSYCLSICRQY